MTRNRLSTLVTAYKCAAEDVSDAELIVRFLNGQDQAAFEALVWRHGPMVRAVCRSILGNGADTDDAFQATFLVLARKAGSIRRTNAVGGWLYGVAVRVARKLKRSLARRVPTDPDLTMAPAPATPPPTGDLGPILDAEIDRLPEKYRAVVHLCYVAGLTTAQTAESLALPKGTVLSRLAWARGRLQSRLTERGITAGVAALATATTAANARVVDPLLVSNTVQAAMESIGAAVPAIVPTISNTTLTLTQGVLSDMAINKLKLTIGSLLLGLSAAGIGVGSWAATGGDEKGKSENTAPLNPQKVEEGAPPPNSKVDLKPRPPQLQSTDERIKEILDRLDEQEKMNRDLRAKLQSLQSPPRTSVNPLPPVNNPPAIEQPKVYLNPPPLETKRPVIEPPKTNDPKAPSKNGTLTIPKPGGTWHRLSKGTMYSMTFEGDRLTIQTSIPDPKEERTIVTLEADYSISRDGVVFGYISSIDVAAPHSDDVHTVEGLPFSFRYRVDEKVMTIRDVKVQPPSAVRATDKDRPRIEMLEMLFGAGRYSSVMPPRTGDAARFEVLTAPPAEVQPPASQIPPNLRSIPVQLAPPMGVPPTALPAPAKPKKKK